MNSKKIVHQVTGRYMRKNKKRTLTTFLGILFMVLLMTCVFVGKDTAISYLKQLAANVEGNWHICFWEITRDEYENLKALEGVEDSTYWSEYGYAEFEKSNNELKPYLQINAYSEKNFDWMNIKVVEGRLPENEKEIILSYAAVKEGADIKIGDTIHADCFELYNEPVGDEGDYKAVQHFNGIEETYRVVGFMEASIWENADEEYYSCLTYVEEEKLPEKFNAYFQLDFNKSSSFYREYPDILKGDAEAVRNEFLLLFTADSSDVTINRIISLMMAFFILLIVAASVILIYNVFNISFEERSRYLGMLSSVGATGKQRRESIYYEAFLLLVFALPIGILAGCGVVMLGMTALKPYIDSVMAITAKQAVSLSVSFKDILFIVIFCIVTVAVSAFLPARKICRAKEIECIRGNGLKNEKIYKTNEKALKTFAVEGMLAGNMLSRQKRKAKGLISSITVFMVILIVTSYSTILSTKMVHYILVEDKALKIEVSSELGKGSRFFVKMYV